jgi:hypothetical protein
VGGLVCPFRADRDRDYDGDEDGGHSLSVPLRAFPTFDEDRDDDGDEDGGGIACLSPPDRDRDRFGFFYPWWGEPSR